MNIDRVFRFDSIELAFRRSIKVKLRRFFQILRLVTRRRVNGSNNVRNV